MMSGAIGPKSTFVRQPHFNKGWQHSIVPNVHLRWPPSSHMEAEMTACLNKQCCAETIFSGDVVRNGRACRVSVGCGVNVRLLLQKRMAGRQHNPPR